MGIPLPALSIRPPAAPEDPLSQFGRVVALRNMLQTAPLQQQALAQEAQLRGVQLQQAQYQLGATQAMNRAWASAVKPDENGIPPRALRQLPTLREPHRSFCLGRSDEKSVV